MVVILLLDFLNFRSDSITNLDHSYLLLGHIKLESTVGKIEKSERSWKAQFDMAKYVYEIEKSFT